VAHNYLFKVRELTCAKENNKEESQARKITAEKVAGIKYKKKLFIF